MVFYSLDTIRARREEVNSVKKEIVGVNQATELRQSEQGARARTIAKARSY
jgi:hypothetical protein